MKRATITSILAIVGAAPPAVSLAGPAGQYKTDDYNVRSGKQAPRPLFQMNLTPTKPLVRPYAEIGMKPELDRVPTTVSYKPFPNGPVGSVGLVRFNASHALDSSALGNASEGQPGAPSQTVGANLLYAFR
jgi:hypothetical protein